MYTILGYDCTGRDFEELVTDRYSVAQLLASELERRGYVMFVMCGKRYVKF